MVDAIGTAGTANEKLEFIRRASVVQAQTLTIGTHGFFVFEDAGLIIAARLADRQAYEDAMAVIGELVSDLGHSNRKYYRENPEEGSYPGPSVECEDSKRTAKLCGLLFAAQLLAHSGARGPIAIALLQDALDLAKGPEIDPKVGYRVRIALTDAQWRYGEPSLAAALMAEMEPDAVKRSATPSDYVIYQRLRAEMADAALNPQVAAQAVAEVIECALQAVKATDESIDLDAIGEAVDSLVARYVYQSFCSGCGEEVRTHAKRWLLRDYKQDGLSTGSAASNYLLYRLMPDIKNAGVTPASFPAAIHTTSRAAQPLDGSVTLQNSESHPAMASESSDHQALVPRS
jgi:hypothetical protein